MICYVIWAFKSNPSVDTTNLKSSQRHYRENSNFNLLFTLHWKSLAASRNEIWFKKVQNVLKLKGQEFSFDIYRFMKIF